MNASTYIQRTSAAGHYVACRDFLVGNNRKTKPGDHVPEVFGWTFNVVVAHLNLGWIKWVDRPYLSPKAADQAPQAATDNAVVNDSEPGVVSVQSVLDNIPPMELPKTRGADLKRTRDQKKKIAQKAQKNTPTLQGE